MGWVRIEDDLPNHPKVLKAGPQAGWLHICGITYANRYLTDGFIPEEAVATLFSGSKSPGATQKIVQRLVSAGLWHEAVGGWLIHDYLEFNVSRGKVEAERAKSADRVTKWRDVKRQSNAVTTPLQDKVYAECNAVTSPLPDDGCNAECNAVTSGTTSTSTSTSTRRTTSPNGDDASVKKPPNGKQFSKRLARELITEHQVKFEPTTTRHQATRALLTAALTVLPPEQHQPTSMGVICDYVLDVQGISITAEARAHTARLVRLHDPLEVLDAFGQALEWGAGIPPEYAKDPIALTKYVAGVLAKRKVS